MTITVKTLTGRTGTLRLNGHGQGRFFYDLVIAVGPLLQAACGGPYPSVEAARDAGIRNAIEFKPKEAPQ